MNNILYNNQIKFVLIILGYIFWKTLLTHMVGGEATMAAFLVQAIYCRARYFRDNQFLGSPYAYVEIEAEVVEWNHSNTIH